jgi:hypothetical protein
MQTRREFVGHLAKGAAGLALVGAGGLTMVGCSVFNQIKLWVPIGITAFGSVVNMLQSAGIINPVEGSTINALILTIKAAFAQILSDISQYQAITPAPVGLLQKIKDGLEIVVTNIQTFLNTISVANNPIISLVTGLIQIILSTISAFQGQLPAAVAAHPVRSFSVKGQVIIVTPKHRSEKQFIKDFNATCVAYGHPEGAIS